MKSLNVSVRQHRLSFLLASALLLNSRMVSAQSYTPGDMVTVIHQGAEFKRGSDVVDTSELGDSYTVHHVEGNWLWIESQGGYLNRSDVVPYNEAIEHFTAIINQDPENSDAFHHRAIVWRKRGEYDIAISDLTEAIRLHPDAAYFNGRGTAWRTKGDPDRAIADFSEAIRLRPSEPILYYNRATAWNDKGDFDRAIADCNEALRLDPNSAIARNELAWIMATASDVHYRDGDQAVVLATVACELTDFREAMNIDTLAAAYAETGDFAQAVEMQHLAVQLVSVEEREDYESRLALYESGQPYHETPQPVVVSKNR